MASSLAQLETKLAKRIAETNEHSKPMEKKAYRLIESAKPRSTNESRSTNKIDWCKFVAFTCRLANVWTKTIGKSEQSLSELGLLWTPSLHFDVQSRLNEGFKNARENKFP